MSLSYAFVIEGQDPAKFVANMTPQIEKAMVMALNKTTERARTDAGRRIRTQVAFPASYLNPSQGRLTIAKKASVQSPEAIIRGRGRATSLARFTKGTLTPGKGRKDGTLTVEVKPGRQHKIARAFIINLKNGNLGFAVRTAGGPPPGAYKPKEIGKNLWLLYGPSVDQVLFSESNGGGIIEEMSPDTLNFLNSEFLRIIDTGILNGDA